jgi:predicted PurR-regulated permease PerM
MRKMMQNKKRGVAIVVALFFSFCMLVLFVAMMYRQSSTSGHNQLTNQERQAFFAARAAMQHFLLKAKLFPTELYDAVEFAQGKNPLCNFAEFEGTTAGGQLAF